MTPEQYIQKLKDLATTVKQKAIESIMIPAANELLANVKNRIFLDGKNSAGQQIGTYSTRKMYAGINQFVKRSSFKPGPRKGAKTMRLDGGYKQLRSIQGRDVAKMNYEYSGGTSLAYQQQVRQNEILQGMTTELASKIRQGLEAKRGKAFSPTQQEIDEYNKNVAIDTQELIRKTLRNA